jgi:hypothetical protein
VGAVAVFSGTLAPSRSRILPSFSRSLSLGSQQTKEVRLVSDVMMPRRLESELGKKSRPGSSAGYKGNGDVPGFRT